MVFGVVGPTRQMMHEESANSDLVLPCSPPPGSIRAKAAHRVLCNVHIIKAGCPWATHCVYVKWCASKKGIHTHTFSPRASWATPCSFSRTRARNIIRPNYLALLVVSTKRKHDRYAHCESGPVGQPVTLRGREENCSLITIYCTEIFE